MSRAARLVAALALTRTAAADPKPPRWTKPPVDKWQRIRYAPEIGSPKIR